MRKMLVFLSLWVGVLASVEAFFYAVMVAVLGGFPLSADNARFAMVVGGGAFVVLFFAYHLASEMPRRVAVGVAAGALVVCVFGFLIFLAAGLRT